MFKAVQRQSSWSRYCFNTTVTARPLRHHIDNVTATTRRNSRGFWIRKFSTHLRKMVKARKYAVVSHFVNEPKPTDLKLVEEDLPPLQNGEYLVEAEYFSVDPYMRAYVQRFPVGITMIGSQVAKIIESKNPDFPVGKKIVGNLGWRTHTIINPNAKRDEVFPDTLILPDLGNLPSSLALGVLGMPGNTAYFGLLEICKAKAGETIVVSGAAGAVGSHVGQIAKNLGLTVIGTCGSDEKCKWLTDELGFDFAINYKTMPIASSLRKAAPQGVDCYFDNVGGDISGTIMHQMNRFGRIAVCGSISCYNADASSMPRCTILQRWIREGKLRYRETVTKGFENMFDAFVGMLRGENVGKAIVQA